MVVDNAEHYWIIISHILNHRSSNNGYHDKGPIGQSRMAI